jgi:DNA-binding CsgD family transcriptional regulator
LSPRRSHDAEAAAGPPGAARLGREGAPARSRAWAELSPQELQIAQLAAEGLSNREIGQQIYLSHRTVESHLYRLFPKLGVTSRAQLRGPLENASDS